MPGRELPLLARVFSAAIQGVDALPVSVEVDLAGGLPALSMVGLPDTAVRESRDRVRTAIQNSGFVFPPRRITVNLAPAHLKKQGTALDLPVAVAILVASGGLSHRCVQGLYLAGELSLDGGIREVRGALSMALAARAHGVGRLLLPPVSAAQASAVEGIEIRPVRSLVEVVSWLKGDLELSPLPLLEYSPDGANKELKEDFADVGGQGRARRALEIAAAGSHNLLMMGPPGAGKTMLARRMPGILPPPDREEAIETTRVHSAAGFLLSEGLLHERPFRAPHHSTSGVGLGGGGVPPRPGEISLAHHGVLFLDELPEFRRGALEVLRQPMEEGRIVLTRAAQVVNFPARFLLVAAMNPCPCGHLGSAGQTCTCTPYQVQGYRGRVSGPLLDRFDIHLEVPRVAAKDLETTRPGEPSSAIRKRILQARSIQTRRFRSHGVSLRTNSEMRVRQIQDFCVLDPGSRRLLSDAVDRLGLSARAHHRILKVARTIADLEASDRVQRNHLAEAIQYRLLDRRTGPS